MQPIRRSPALSRGPLSRRRPPALRQQGKSEEEVEREIAQGLLDGRFRAPRRPAMTYMMSSAQKLYDPQGKLIGQWHPHLMIYYPNLQGAELGLGTPRSLDAALVFDEGQAFSNILVVVRGFVDPKSKDTERRAGY